MIAIPLDKENSTTLSDLYGNAPFFALLDTTTGSFKVVKNEVKGQGPQSAEFLKKKGAASTIFYHMGEGVYKAFVKNGMDIFSSDHTYYTLEEIFQNCLSSKLLKLDDNNYKELLDPGNGSKCTCGCEEAQ
jgi:predicted Fe-Mo cluster-binding NifX family protein